MVKNKITTTTEMSTFDWNKVWFSDETIVEARQTLVEALYIALSPGSLPSACVFAFDCFLTVVHFVVSSYILDDFTTTFLGTVYFPTTFLKILYVIDCISSAEWFVSSTRYSSFQYIR
uniref:Transmembrane protein n=1 Tax=Caenorhabditis tropicalis TaxID=1561998 RepID=A0A1I7UCV0_9PELO